MCLRAPISVFLNWGQSNADGFSSAGIDWVDDGSESEILHRWSSGTPPSDGRSSFGPLAPKSRTSTRFGLTPILYPSRAINSSAPETEKFAVIEAALGSTSIGARSANNWLPDNPLYTIRILDFVRQSLKQLEAMGYAPRIDRMLCFQGESDAFPEHEDNWGELFHRFINRVKREFDCPHMAIVICKTYSTRDDNTAVNAAQDAAALSIPRCATVETSDLDRTDIGDVHITSTGSLNLFPRIVTAFNSLQ